ncbi:substrate-binding periplasmic protein [Alteromonas sediminis]|uniref:substrate-binding periplasmic protein n=1 Tax=Alteromonas sediminis TaxID=2259342 RepID=UPI0014044753|nr:transporter substrate-binding domain-containing protein [Alteromonas sediminis]
MRCIKVSLFLLLCLLLPGTAAAQAAQDNTELHTDDGLWVITNLEPLFSEQDDRGRLTGYAVELVRLILADAGFNNNILSAPWQRILAESAEKPDVLVFSLARTPEREDQFYWITPVTQNTYAFYALQGHSNGVSSLTALPKTSRVAVLENDFRHKALEKAGIKAVPTQSWGEALQALYNGQADYLFFSDGGVNVTCANSGFDCTRIKKAFVYQQATTYVALSKPGTNPALAERLKQAARSVKSAEQYTSLVNEWLATYAKRTALPISEENGVLILGQVNAD